RSSTGLPVMSKPCRSGTCAPAVASSAGGGTESWAFSLLFWFSNAMFAASRSRQHPEMAKFHFTNGSFKKGASPLPLQVTDVNKKQLAEAEPECKILRRSSTSGIGQQPLWLNLNHEDHACWHR